MIIFSQARVLLNRVRALGALALLGLSPVLAHAASGTWSSTTSGGNWSNSGNWSGGIIADASGSTAFFNAVDISTDPFVVHLDSARTLSDLNFADTNTASAAGWLLDNNGVPGNTLTLAGTRTITVGALGTNKSATISAVLGGSAGLTKAGGGTLILSGANTYSGTTDVSVGKLSLQDTTSNTINGAVSIANGATLAAETASGNNVHRINGNLTLTGGTLSGNSNVSSTANGQFYFDNSIAHQVIVTGDNQATIAAEMHFGGSHTFNVANGLAPVDLLVTGKLSHQHGIVWGGIAKDGAGTMHLVSSMNGTDAAGTLGIFGLGGVEMKAGTLIFDGALGYSPFTPAAKAGFHLADFTGNSTLKWGTGNTTDISVNGNMRIGAGITATLDTGANNVTLAGNIANGGAGAALTKTGSGTLTLSGNNSYTGATTVNEGKISLQDATSNTLGAVIIANGATLAAERASGANVHRINGNLTLTGGTLSGNSNVSSTANGQFYFDNSIAHQVIVTGDNQSTIAAEMHFGGSHTFNVADGLAPVDLLVTGKLSHQHGIVWGGIAKAGAGTMHLASSMNGTDAAGTLGIFGLGGVEMQAGTLIFDGALGYSPFTPAAKSGFHLANFTGDSTLRWGVGNTTDISVNGNLRIGAGVTATLDTGANNVTLGTGIVSGGAGSALTKTGTGQLTLGAANAYTGGTQVLQGTLEVTANNALGTTAAGTTVSNGARLLLSNTSYTTTEALTLNGAGIGGLNGALHATGTSRWDGNITAQTHATIYTPTGSTLTLGNSGAPAVITKNGTTLTFDGGGTVTVNSQITGATDHTSDLNITGGSTVILTNINNNYMGPTNIINGTLQLGASSVVPNGSEATFGSAGSASTFNLASFSDTVRGLSSTAAGNGVVRNSVNATTSTLTLAPQGTETWTFTGAIQQNPGTVNLEMAGAAGSTQQLGGTNTYTGTTTVTTGTLELVSGGSLQNSAVAVNGGTFLQSGGTNNVTGAAGVGNLSIASGAAYTLNAGTLDFQDTTGATNHHAGGTASQINLTGTAAFNFNGGALQDVSTINTAGLTGTFTQSGGNFFIGENEPGGETPDNFARTTTINGGFTLLAGGTVHFDAFGAESTPTDYSNAEPIDLLRVTGIANLNGIVDFDDEYGAEFGDVHTLVLAPTINLGPNFAVDGGFFRVVPTGPTGPGFALQAIVPEPSSIMLWSVIGLLGAAGAGQARRQRVSSPR